MQSVAKSILVVDDDPVVLKIARQGLSALLNADVTTSSDPEYAFELALKIRFDLYLFDFSMPKIRGDLLFNLLCVAHANGRDANLPPTPLLLMTGHGGDADARELLRRPLVRGLLPKPFDMETLVHRVSACFPGEFPDLED